MESNSYSPSCGLNLIICYDEYNTANVVNNNMAGYRVQNIMISKSKSPMDVNFNFLYLYSWLWNNLYVAITKYMLNLNTGLYILGSQYDISNYKGRML